VITFGDMSKILLVDDDVDLAEMLEEKLTREQHTVELVYDGFEARDRLRFYKYDAVVLDWDLPGLSGIEICKQMRSAGDITPVLMLTGKNTIDDKEAGLDAGADDYLTKPFDAREFAARVRSIIRRGCQAASNVLTARDLVLDMATHKVTKGDQELDLLPKEFALLEFFMRNPSQVFSAEMLLDRVWSSESEAAPEALRVCLARLRKKIDTADQESVISTVRGVGYKLDA
jgi:DNA-binding response OmpR family regulator